MHTLGMRLNMEILSTTGTAVVHEWTGLGTEDKFHPSDHRLPTPDETAVQNNYLSKDWQDKKGKPKRATEQDNRPKYNRKNTPKQLNKLNDDGGYNDDDGYNDDGGYNDNGGYNDDEATSTATARTDKTKDDRQGQPFSCPTHSDPKACIKAIIMIDKITNENNTNNSTTLTDQTPLSTNCNATTITNETNYNNQTSSTTTSIATTEYQALPTIITNEDNCNPTIITNEDNCNSTIITKSNSVCSTAIVTRNTRGADITQHGDTLNNALVTRNNREADIIQHMDTLNNALVTRNTRDADIIQHVDILNDTITELVKYLQHSTKRTKPTRANSESSSDTDDRNYKRPKTNGPSTTELSSRGSTD